MRGPVDSRGLRVRAFAGRVPEPAELCMRVQVERDAGRRMLTQCM